MRIVLKFEYVNIDKILLDWHWLLFYKFYQNLYLLFYQWSHRHRLAICICWTLAQLWIILWTTGLTVKRQLSIIAPVGGGPRVVVSTAAFHARVRGSVPGLGGLKETKMFLPHPRVKVSIVGSLRDREVACSASDRQGSNFESCVWRTVSSQSSHHPREVLLAQFSLYVHKGGLKPDSFDLISLRPCSLASVDCYLKYSTYKSDSINKCDSSYK